MTTEVCKSSNGFKLIPYTSALPNKACLNAIDRYYNKWRFLLSPASVKSVYKANRHLLDRGYAIDNGAYAYYLKGVEFNDKAFIKLLDRYAEKADWIVIPDVIGDCEETIRMFGIWIGRLLKYNRPLLFVAQDGCEDSGYKSGINYPTIEGFTSIGIGIFIGGSTEWKIKHGGYISEICERNNVVCHVGRVNSARRVRICNNWGASSFDGSGMSRFTRTAELVSEEIGKINCTKQLQLF